GWRYLRQRNSCVRLCDASRGIAPPRTNTSMNKNYQCRPDACTGSCSFSPVISTNPSRRGPQLVGASARRLTIDHTLILNFLDRKKFQMCLIVYLENGYCCRRRRPRHGRYFRGGIAVRVSPKTYDHNSETCGHKSGNGQRDRGARDKRLIASCP